jgi:hypothetical protein
MYHLLCDLHRQSSAHLLRDRRKEPRDHRIMTKAKPEPVWKHIRTLGRHRTPFHLRCEREEFGGEKSIGFIARYFPPSDADDNWHRREPDAEEEACMKPDCAKSEPP